MNTKQLWNALSSNPCTKKYFDGIYSFDNLKDIKCKPKLIICNTDPSYKPGKHWVLFFFNDNYVEFYDSLGKDITVYGGEFPNFIKNFVENYERSNERTQPMHSSLCGQYCLYYAYCRCKGINMRDIITSMSSPQKVIALVEKEFYMCNNSNCPLLQKCLTR